MQRNLYCSLKAPSVFLDYRDSFTVGFSPSTIKATSASGSNFAVRMASRRVCLTLHVKHLRRSSLAASCLYEI